MMAKMIGLPANGLPPVARERPRLCPASARCGRIRGPRDPLPRSRHTRRCEGARGGNGGSVSVVDGGRARVPRGPRAMIRLHVSWSADDGSSHRRSHSTRPPPGRAQARSPRAPGTRSPPSSPQCGRTPGQPGRQVRSRCRSPRQSGRARIPAPSPVAVRVPRGSAADAALRARACRRRDTVCTSAALCGTRRSATGPYNDRSASPRWGRTAGHAALRGRCVAG
jgi:hypothetical protein